MENSSNPPARSFGVPQLLALLFFCYAAFQLYFYGSSPLNWLGFVLEGLGFVLIARVGRTAIRDLWRVAWGRVGILLIVVGAVLTPFATH
jgi:hypothetical protein